MKHLFTCVCSFLLIALTVSCVDEGSSVGEKWVETSFYNVYADTCTVTLSTILADSIVTSSNTVSQLGYYRDEYRGVMKSSFFTEYNTASLNVNSNYSYRFDSVTISLYPTGDILGDSLTPHTLNIHRLTESIEMDERTNYLFNTSNVAYDPTPLTSVSFYNRPSKGQEIILRLPDDFGRFFYDLMLESSDDLDSQDRFRQRFQGLAFIPGDDNKDCMSGFFVNDSSMCINIHYRINELLSEHEDESLIKAFTPHSTQNFIKFEQDLDNTPFNAIRRVSNNTLKSDTTANIAYLQGLAGLYISIEFPYLNRILEAGDLVSIDSGILNLFPVRDSYSEEVPLPPSLTLYTATDSDIFDGIITNSTGTSVQNGNLVENSPIRDSYYSFDITSFLQTNLGTSGPNRQKLMLRLPDETFLNTPQSLILGNQNFYTPADNTVRLQLLYKVYQKND